MAINNITYPVTGTDGAYANIFPSQRALDMTATRKDAGITAISSGTGGVVRIQADATLTGIAVGDYISWGSDAYTARSSRVITVVAVDTVEVVDLFTSTNATNGFVNYKRNWFFEIRYVLKDSTTDNQSAIPILDFNSKFTPNKSGAITANIGAPALFINPDFQTVDGFNTGLYQEYKVQYRESWDSNRVETWVSPATDVPIMLVHGSEDIPIVTFSDADILKRYTRGYPVLGSFIYSDVNDGAGGNQITINLKEYRINKTLIATTQVIQETNFNGVYIFALDSNTFDVDTVFIKLESEIIADVGQYEPTEYETTEYA